MEKNEAGIVLRVDERRSEAYIGRDEFFSVKVLKFAQALITFSRFDF